MPSGKQQIVRQILDAVEDDEGVSQRSLATQLGISVGSVNWYLKRCVSKGLIKLQQAPVKRYLYYLTPKGFEEKARLTASYMRYSLAFFREGRAACDAFFRACEEAGLDRLALAGDGDLAEIAVLSALEHGARLMAVIDDGAAIDGAVIDGAVIGGEAGRQACAGVPVVASLEALEKRSGGVLPQAILLTDLSDPRKTHAAMRRALSVHGLSEEMINVPRMLRFRPDKRGDCE